MGEKAYKGWGMTGIIARLYAGTVEQVYEDYAEMAARIKKVLTGQADILDVACGPGFLSVELAGEPAYHVTGLDISQDLVDIAKRKAREKNVPVKFVVGNAAHMPFDDAQFDFVICLAAFNYFTAPLEAVNEMCRVLRPGGKALIVDIRNDVANEDIDCFVNRMRLGFWNTMLTTLNFKWVLKKRAYSMEQMERFATVSKFRYFQIEKGWIGFELWLQK